MGVIRDYNSNVILDLDKGALTMKKGSINIGNGNFTVDEQGNLYARRGTFAGTLAGAKGTFGGTVQAEDFLDKYGNSMMDLAKEKFTAGYLDLYGLTVTNKSTGAVTFAVGPTGLITINGQVTMGAGSTINWAQVNNQNLHSNPAYSLANNAYNLADDAYYEAELAYDRRTGLTSWPTPSRCRGTSRAPTSTRPRSVPRSSRAASSTARNSTSSPGATSEASTSTALSGAAVTTCWPSNISRATPLSSTFTAPAADTSPLASRRNGIVYFEGIVDFSAADVQGLDLGTGA